MNYKTMLLCAVIGASMQSAWGMDGDVPRVLARSNSDDDLISSFSSKPNQNPNQNSNSNAIVKPEISDTARLAAAMEVLGKNMERMAIAQESQAKLQKDIIEGQKELLAAQKEMTNAVILIHNVNQTDARKMLRKVE
jgi:hypothetical protein